MVQRRALIVALVASLAAAACGPRAKGSVLAGAPRERSLSEPTVDEAKLRPDTFGHGARGTELDIRGCDVPFEYALGKLDPRFGLGRKQALAALTAAAARWERLAGRPMFRYSPSSGFKVDFLFDERQEMMIERVAGRDSVDAILRRHAQLRAEHDRALFAYDERRRAYEATVASSNQQGGAPPERKRELDDEKQALRAEQARVDAMLPRLEALAFFINSRGRAPDPADYPNLLAGTTRRQVTGDRVTRLRIEIYMFRSWQALTFVLAHELGHSLGLEHVAAADAIMYGSPSGVRAPSASDAIELKRVCPNVP